jgi:SPP1 family predicted phage head-tail adaptor
MTTSRAFPCLTELNKRITIEAPRPGPSDGGSATISWQSIGVVWAALRPTASRETVASDGQSLHTSHEIWLRYRSDLTGAMRFRLGGRVFAIQSMRDPDERQRWLICQTDERRA